MLVPRTAAPSHTSVAQGLLLRYDEAKANIDRDFKLPPSHIWQCTLSLQGCVGSCVRHYWQNGGTSLNLLLFCRHGPRMKESGFMILTCFFLSSAELNEENIKVLIVFERSMRRHKAFCSCAQIIIHKVNHWHLQKSVPGWAQRLQFETMRGIAIWSLFVRKVFMAKEFAEFRA